MDQATIVVLLCSLWTAGSALECYKCESSKVASKSGSGAAFLQKLTGSAEENRACNEAGLTDMGSVPTETCASGQVCGDVRASITVSESIGNSAVTLESVARGCMSQESNGVYQRIGEYCSESASIVKDATNVLLTVLNDLPFVNVKVDGEVCFCLTDLCTAGRCGDDSFKIGGYCVKYWYVAVPAGIVLLLIISCCCCCCCGCCGCCKKNPPRPFVIQQTFIPGGAEQTPYVRFEGNEAQAMTV